MIQTVLNDLACKDREISILFTNDSHIQELNLKYLNRNRSTNVLAFPMRPYLTRDVESGMLGDVVISVDTAMREAESLEESLEITIYRLLIHGVLHLLGYDHEKSESDEKTMTDEEKRLLLLVRED